ncbi:MAG: RNA 3'-phosphate cyclase, partial [Deltaproteobacteria bacterium]|nr:RNA 3'-phosphate cyclase [Deltaproteobacteria bacterium]
DQLIPFASLSEGWTAYRIPRMSDHIEARLWLVEELLGAKTEVKGNLVRIRGIGYTK